MATEYYEIEDGPSKFDLMISLFDGGKDFVHRRRVRFVLAEGFKMDFIELIVDSLTRDSFDLSGNFWKFSGFVPGTSHRRNAVTANGEYNARNREGLIGFNHHE